jgi:hypothetical protein
MEDRLIRGAYDASIVVALRETNQGPSESGAPACLVYLEPDPVLPNYFTARQAERVAVTLVRFAKAARRADAAVKLRARRAVKS